MQSGPVRETNRWPRSEGALASFFGRVADIEAIRAALGNGDQLVTLVGPGGIGKTSVARRYCTLHGDEYTGVWFCDLTEARAPGDVCAAVERALGVEGAEHVEATWIERLGHSIERRGRALLILDNCEQVVEAVAGALGRWRELAPAACWLLTSREPLRVEGEHPHELGPLGMPTGGDVMASEAVQLFVARARLANSGYAVSDVDAAAVAQIVRKLDGLPLAIELAAARMSVMSASALLDRLPQGLETLGAGRRDASARQKTLRATIEWSRNLLQPWEQSALRQCSVFRGGFTLDAAENVLDLSPFAQAPRCLDVVQALREKSLLRSYGPPEGPGQLRLGFYETIREFAAEDLRAHGAENATRARHAQYYLDKAPTWAEAYVDGDYCSAEESRGLALEFDNLMVVCDWAIAQRAAHPDRGREVLLATLLLLPTLQARASLQTITRHLDAALDGFPPQPSDRSLYSRLLDTRASLKAGMGANADARDDAESALKTARSANDPREEARALMRLGQFAFKRGETRAARERLDAAMALCTDARSDRMKGRALACSIDCDSYDGNLEGACARYPEAIARTRALADHWLLRSLLTNYAITLQELGRLDDAANCFGEARQVARSTGDRRPGTIGYFAGLHHERGNLEDAERGYVEAIQIAREIGWHRIEQVFSGALAALYATSDRVGDAERLFHEVEVALADVPALPAISLHRGHLDLAWSRASARAGDERAAASHRDAARRRLASPQEHPSDETRFAQRLLETALSLLDTEEMSVSAEDDRALLVGPEGLWFRAPAGKLVDLQHRPRARGMLLALVRARCEAPGKPVPVALLVRDVWEGERMLASAGAQRAYSMLLSLRRAGLRDVILSRDNGYLIDPAIEVVRREPP